MAGTRMLGPRGGVCVVSLHLLLLPGQHPDSELISNSHWQEWCTEESRDGCVNYKPWTAHAYLPVFLHSFPDLLHPSSDFFHPVSDFLLPFSDVHYSFSDVHHSFSDVLHPSLL